MRASCRPATCPTATAAASPELLQDLQGIRHEARRLEDRLALEVAVDYDRAVLALIRTHSMDAMVAQDALYCVRPPAEGALGVFVDKVAVIIHLLPVERFHEA